MMRRPLTLLSAAALLALLAGGPQTVSAAGTDTFRITKLNVTPVEVYDDDVMSHKIGAIDAIGPEGVPVQHIADNLMLQIKFDGRLGWIHPMTVDTNIALEDIDIGPCNKFLGGSDPGGVRGIGEACKKKPH